MRMGAQMSALAGRRDEFLVRVELPPKVGELQFRFLVRAEVWPGEGRTAILSFW